jgi:hypothetical protein
MMRYSLGALLLAVTAIAAGFGLREGNPALVGALVLMLLVLCAGVSLATVTHGRRAAADLVLVGIIAIAFILLLMIF